MRTSGRGRRRRLVAYGEESAAAAAKRLSAALDAAFRKEAPGAKWIFEPSIPHETGPDGQPPKLLYKAGKGAPKSLEMFAGDGGVLNKGRKARCTWASTPPTAFGRTVRSSTAPFLPITKSQAVLS